MNAIRNQARRTRLGRIGYLNVLPIYHPLEAGWIPHDLELTSGPPAELNDLIRQGGLDLSSCSSVEYARNPHLYRLLPDLAIGSRGPVKSVLLLSRIPIRDLADKTVLVTAETHTSATLLRIVLERVYAIHPEFVRAKHSLSLSMAAGATSPAMLAIGDEALSLRGHAEFPYQLDLGEVWRDWTGLPFVFGVWVARRDAVDRDPQGVRQAARLLAESKRAGVAAIEEVVSLAALAKTNMRRGDIRRYFDCLSYDLGESEQAGLRLFFQYLAEHGFIETPPPLDILD